MTKLTFSDLKYKNSIPGEAVVHLSVDGFTYSPLIGPIVYEQSDDGPGVVLLHLDPESEIAQFLSSDNLSESPNTPKSKSVLCCPHCQAEDISQNLVQWESRSLEPQDRDNMATLLEEHQCQSCGLSFWT